MKRWPLLLGLVLGLIAFNIGMHAGSDPIEGLRLAARYTARAGFPLLIVAFSASSLVRLRPGNLTRALLRDRRWWGLSFALCHTVHLYAFVQFFHASGKPVPLLGAPVYVLMYAMVLTSTNAAHRAMGRNWKRLHRLGIYALWFAFAFAYLGKAATGAERWITVPFAVLTLAAMALRFAAWRKARPA